MGERLRLSCQFDVKTGVCGAVKPPQNASQRRGGAKGQRARDSEAAARLGALINSYHAGCAILPVKLSSGQAHARARICRACRSAIGNFK
jgi:hypothetical protein